jgi:hypothetical protein
MLRPWVLVAMIGCVAPEDGARDRVASFSVDTPHAGGERSWRPLTNPAPFGAALAHLLTDGTVMVQEISSNNWWRLTPDIMGSYSNGTWSQLASMPADYGPLYAASAVLPDGRVIVEGGEYLFGNAVWSTRGEIYDPLTNRWQTVNAPPGWGSIGDASGIVLANGTFMLSDCCTTKSALFDPRTLLWRDTGSGKLDIHDEESWALLPDGTVLTVDANNQANPQAYEIYDPETGTWTSPGTTPILISDPPSHEVGPEILRSDGTVLAIGGNGHNAIYDTKSKMWSIAPDLPMQNGMQLDIADGPAALLPNGDVLLAASPGVFNPPVTFFEFNGTFKEVAAPPNASGNTSYANFLLLLPTGEVMLTDFTNDIELYTPAAGVAAAAVPVITSVPALVTKLPARALDEGEPPLDGAESTVRLRPLTTIELGRTYKLAGKRFNGISQGAYYGDDQQSSTNYPLVRLTNVVTKHVAFCRTHDHGPMSIAPETRGTTRFDVPATADRGLANLVVIANGISSPPILVNVK